MNYKIRKANLNDIDSIIELYRRLSSCMVELQQEFMNLPKKSFEYCNEENENYFRDVLVSSNNAIFVAEIKKKVVGFIQACVNEKDFNFDLDKYCYIPYYYVEETCRNFSLNIDLYKEVEKWAYEKKLNYICSDVDGGNDISLKMQKKFCGMKPFKIRLVKQL